VSPSLATTTNRLYGLCICLTLEYFYVYIHARIEPGNAFRVVLKCGKYTTDVEYGLIEMVEQEHELWLDRSSGYSLAQFYDDVATISNQL
jgi:hypothetical protein